MSNTIARIQCRSAKPHRWSIFRMRMLVVLSIVLACGACGQDDPIVEARAHLLAGEIGEGLSLLRELVDQGSRDPEVLYLYGVTLVQTGQPGLAEWPLRRAMEDPEWFERAALQLAQSASAGGNFENAAAVLAEVIERDPDNVEARLLRASALAASPRHVAEALEEVDRIFEIAPDEFRAYEPKILAHLSLEDPEAAADALAELGERIDEGGGNERIRGWYCATLAIFADDSGEETLARERWADCNERFPAHENVVTKSIAFHDARREYERSLEIARSAFEADPSSAAGYRNLVADHLMLVGRPDEAEALLREATTDDDPVAAASAWLALAHHYELRHDAEAAARAIEQGLEVMGDRYGPQPNLLFSLAETWIRAGELDRALALTDQMTVAAHRALVRGRVAQDRGRHAEALAQYEEATRLWPDNPYALYHAGRAALALGELDRAIAAFRGSTRVSQSATDASYQAARILAAEGRWNAARELLGQAKASLGLPGELLQIEALAHTHGAGPAWAGVYALARRQPARIGEAMAAAVDGVGESRDAGAAWELIEPALDQELTPGQRAAVLESAVRWAPEDSEADWTALGRRVAGLVEAAPELADVRALEGAYLERRGDRSGANAAYRRALALDSEQERALLRLAALLAEEDRAEALALIERALEGDREPDRRMLARAIAPRADGPDLEALLERALESAPTNAAVALRLAGLLSARGGDADRVRALAQRAARLGAGQEAHSLLVKTQESSRPLGDITAERPSPH